MAKDNRQIHGSIRIGGKVYVGDMTDELAAVLPAGELDRLTDAGVISGFEKPKAEPKAEGKGKKAEIKVEEEAEEK